VTRWDESVFALAERLHMPVYRLKQEMPLVEFLGWMHYYREDKGPVIDLSTASAADLAVFK